MKRFFYNLLITLLVLGAFQLQSDLTFSHHYSSEIIQETELPHLH
ncbi:hypothetical protein [Tepidibacillus marianensis]